MAVMDNVAIDHRTKAYRIGSAYITPVIDGDALHSIGRISIHGVPVRGESVRFLPWFDTLNGDLFHRFRLNRIEHNDDRLVFHTTAISNPDVIFRRERDSSGDEVFRNHSWDTEPLDMRFRIVMESARETIDGVVFDGIRYWFEFESDDISLHRILDRQTWELGGTVDDLRVCIRNWSHAPMVRLNKETAFSTGGLVESFAVAFPGNLWARWSMMPAFDFQYRSGVGVLAAWYDDVSLIRNLVESSAGEDVLRCMDMHFFEKNVAGRTNPKSVMFAPKAVANDVDAANLWTRLYDREQIRSRKALGIRLDEDPPRVMLSENHWVRFHPDHSYDKALETAAEFGVDTLFIDPIWENEQTVHEMIQDWVPPAERHEIENMYISNMCATLDYRISRHRGGPDAYRRLVDRAREMNVNVITWGATHISSRSTYFTARDSDRPVHNAFAQKESGRHPDTGYPGECWPVNLHSSLKERIQRDLHHALEDTGLHGFLWDSFSNLGWWHIDYADGTLRPQFREMADLYASFVNKGYYIRPEALVAFSNHSGLGMAAGNLYPPGLLATYSYNTEISLSFEDEADIIRGRTSCDLLFHWFANRHPPSIHVQRVPRDDWDEEAVAKLKRWIHLYKACRADMVRRTILDNCTGILWEGNGSVHVWVLAPMSSPADHAVDRESGEEASQLSPFRVYELKGYRGQYAGEYDS